MPTTPPEAIERPLWHSALSFVARLAATALILGAFSYSLIGALNGPATRTAALPSSRSAGSATPIAGATGVSISLDPPELLTLTLCSGATVIAPIGSGPTYHMYVFELLSQTDSVSPADSRVSQSNCFKPGVGNDIFF